MRVTNGAMARVYKLYTFLVYALPMIALYAWKHDEFATEGSAFGFWGIVVVFLLVIAFKNLIVDFFKKYSLLSISLGILFLGLFSEFLADNLLIIGVFSTVSSLFSLCVSVVADVYTEHAHIMENGEKKVNKAPAISQKEAWKEAYFFDFVANTEIEPEEPEENDE